MSPLPPSGRIVVLRIQVIVYIIYADPIFIPTVKSIEGKRICGCNLIGEFSVDIGVLRIIVFVDIHEHQNQINIPAPG